MVDAPSTCRRSASGRRAATPRDARRRSRARRSGGSTRSPSARVQHRRRSRARGARARRLGCRARPAARWHAGEPRARPRAPARGPAARTCPRSRPRRRGVAAISTAIRTSSAGSTGTCVRRPPRRRDDPGPADDASRRSAGQPVNGGIAVGPGRPRRTPPPGRGPGVAGARSARGWCRARPERPARPSGTCRERVDDARRPGSRGGRRSSTRARTRAVVVDQDRVGVGAADVDADAARHPASSIGTVRAGVKPNAFGPATSRPRGVRQTGAHGEPHDRDACAVADPLGGHGMRRGLVEHGIRSGTLASVRTALGGTQVLVLDVDPHRAPASAPVPSTVTTPRANPPVVRRSRSTTVPVSEVAAARGLEHAGDALRALRLADPPRERDGARAPSRRGRPRRPSRGRPRRRCRRTHDVMPRRSARATARRRGRPSRRCRARRRRTRGRVTRPSDVHRHHVALRERAPHRVGVGEGQPASARPGDGCTPLPPPISPAISAPTGRPNHRSAASTERPAFLARARTSRCRPWARPSPRPAGRARRRRDRRARRPRPDRAPRCAARACSRRRPTSPPPPVPRTAQPRANVVEVAGGPGARAEPRTPG